MDIEANRNAQKYTRAELATRLLWAAVKPLFRFSPRLCYGWRNFLLLLFGAKVGRGVRIHNRVDIFYPANLEIGDFSSVNFDALLYNLGPLRIGKNVTISQRTHLCGGSHDPRDPLMALEKHPITIGDQAWVCADAFVGPGVTLGPESLAAACSVVIKDVPAHTIVAGNPARPKGQRHLSEPPAAPTAPCETQPAL